MSPTLTAEQIGKLIPQASRPRKFNGRLLHQPLPDQAVRDIRRRWEAGEPIKVIAGDHNITRAAVSLIGSRQRHRHVV